MTTPNILRAICLGALAMTTACADAPITAAQLAEDGQLRAESDSSVALFAAEPVPEARLEAQPISLSAVLATDVEEAPTLKQRSRRGKAVEQVYNLMLDGEGLRGPLPVAIVWSHHDQSREQTAVVQPGADRFLAATQRFEPDAAGKWRVEVYALRAGDRDLMLAREFEITQ